MAVQHKWIIISPDLVLFAIVLLMVWAFVIAPTKSPNLEIFPRLPKEITNFRLLQTSNNYKDTDLVYT